MTTTKKKPVWQKYERAIHKELKRLFPSANLRHNVRRRGLRSRTLRQIDVLMTETVEGREVLTVIDAKHHARKIDVKVIEAFLGLLRDLGIDRGLMVTKIGYSEAALERAFRENVDVDLDIMTFAQLKEWQAFGGIPYAGRNAVLVGAPLGWILDGQRRTGALACLYRRGFSLEDAGRAREWIYVNIWDRNDPVSTVDALVEHQNTRIRLMDASASIAIREYKVGERRIVIRRADIPSYPSLEITGFVEFRNGIFFAVLFTPPQIERRNVRKLEYVLERAIHINVRRAA